MDIGLKDHVLDVNFVCEGPVPCVPIELERVENTKKNEYTIVS